MLGVLPSRAEHEKANPEFPWLELGDLAGVRALLERLGWLLPGEQLVGAARAGEGNMNLALRLSTSYRSLILKQARPWVEKYDNIEAPWNRSLYEQRFYRRVERIEGVADRMPRLLGADAASATLLLEDLTDASDLFDLYVGGSLAAAEVEGLADYAARLHRSTRGAADPDFRNAEMRALNHAHIFELPHSGELDLPLDEYEPGLAEAASELQRDADYGAALRATGERYLSQGSCLLHGDYFPGSWMRSPRGVHVIDPEFCFWGDAEFDLGVAVAHFALARQDGRVVQIFLEPSAGDPALVARYAAAEIMRRLVGVAQLPIPPSAGWRAELLEKSRRALLKSSLEPLQE